MVKSDSPLRAFIRIQQLQEELDTAKKEQREWGKKVRSLSQKIPDMIRQLKIQ